MQREILSQIRSLTINLIKHSLTIRENFPMSTNSMVAWDGYQNISFALKNEKYSHIYIKCIEDEEYNFILIDGAIIQLMYSFYNRNITSHRLVFYPNPFDERFQDDAEEFEEKYFGAELFTDIIDSKNDHTPYSIAVPIRVDYDNDKEKYQDSDHPYTHMTIGNYKNCRIPVAGPISPYRFMDFILRNFYNDKYSDDLKRMIKCDIDIDQTISANEKALLHISYNKTSDST